MRTNIKYNSIPNNFFIMNNNKIYIDSTNDYIIKTFNSSCKNLELIYGTDKKQSINQELTSNQETLINKVFNSNSKYNGLPRITPLNYFNKGLWKTKTSEYVSDDINDIYIDYPINVSSPNCIVIDEKNESELLFQINDTLFKNNESFKIYLIPVNSNLSRMFCVNKNVIYDTNVKEYNIKFNNSIFIDSRYKHIHTIIGNYFIALQSNDDNAKIFLSDPSKYIYVTNNPEYSLIDFKINPMQLSYQTSKNKELLIHFYVSGLKYNTHFNIKICDLHNPKPIYYSPDILFVGDMVYNQNIIIPNNINNHEYTVELEYNNISICDLSSCINVDIDYNTNITILNIDDISNIYNNQQIKLVLYFDEKYISSLVNISLNNIFIKNVIITKDNYSNYELIIDDKYIFTPGIYYIRVQNAGINKYYAKSNEYIKILEKPIIEEENIIKNILENIILEITKVERTSLDGRFTILPNFGYKMVPFSYNNIYKPVKSNNKTIIIPNGVTKLSINIVQNKIKYTGIIDIKCSRILSIVSNSNINLLINNVSIFRLDNEGNIIDNILEEFLKEETIESSSITVNYICEDSYIIKLNNLNNLNKFLYVYYANNSTGLNLNYYKIVQVEHNEKYGNHIRLNTTYFDFTGKIFFYLKEELNAKSNMYAGFINITDYAFNYSLNMDQNMLLRNEIVNCKVNIHNYIDIYNIKYFDIFLVDNLNGDSPTYLTKSINNKGILDISFVYCTVDQRSTLELPSKDGSFTVKCRCQDHPLSEGDLNLANQTSSVSAKALHGKQDEKTKKYIMIQGKNDKYIINKIINIPITIQDLIQDNIDNIIKNNTNKLISKNLKSIKLKTAPAKDIIGVYTIFDTPPNKITPAYFLEQYGLYRYKSVQEYGPEYANYAGYLIIKTDPLSNSISQTYNTLNSFLLYIISQLSAKKIDVINVPVIFKSSYIEDQYVLENHVFEYYNSTIYNNTLINVQNSLCLRIVQNSQLITNAKNIQNNFIQAYNDEVRNYTGQNEVANNISFLSTLTSTSPRFSWVEDLGHYIGQYYDLSINNVTIEKITSDWMNIWNEISLPIGHRKGYNKMIGNIDALTNFTSNKLPKTQIKIPLKFYFNKYQNTGMSIPMISLLHSDVKLTIQLDKLENLIISDPLTKFTTSGRPKLKLYLTYIYLDNEERKVFAQNKHEYLIEQQNYRNYNHSGTLFQTKMNLMQPVKDLFWVAPPIANRINKQYFNYTMSKFYRVLKNYDRYDEVNPITEKSRKIYAEWYKKYPNLPYIPLYINDRVKEAPQTDYSAITSSELVLNGQKRFLEERDLTTKINFCRYTNIPVSGIHVYPFARYPTEYQPSGSCNFSQLGDAFFSLTTEPGEYDIKIIARNYNLLRIMGGQAGLAFEL